MSLWGVKDVHKSCFVIALALAVQPAVGAPYNFSASIGTRAASVTFDTQGTDLVVTLANTSLHDAMVPVDVLTGIFFDVSGSSLTLTRTSAVVPVTSAVFHGPVDLVTPGGGAMGVGGEWAYKSAISGPGGRDYGISSAGFGLFGPGDLFPGTDLQPPTSPDGLQYGITSAGDDPFTGNAPMTGSNALIRNEIVFRLGGLPVGFDPSARIQNVLFQYGTGLSEPSIPEPSTLALVGVASLAIVRRKRSSLFA